MILYGRNPVREALRGRRAADVRDIWASTGAAREPWLAGLEVRTASAEELERRCGSSSHQGLCADAGPYRYASADELLAVEDPLLVALDQIQDPQNLGAICRTAECAGAAGVVMPERRSAEVTAAAALTLRDSIRPRIGSETSASQAPATRGRSPRPSEPSTSTTPPV